MGSSFFLLIDFGEGKRERERRLFVVSLIYALIGSFLFVPWLEIKPSTSVYGDNAQTHWATRPGLGYSFDVDYFSFSNSLGVLKRGI